MRINVICPGGFKTAIHDKTVRRDLDEIKIPVEFPEGTIPLTHVEQGEPEQVARLVVFFASEAADHVTGTEMWIDGAESLLKGAARAAVGDGSSGFMGRLESRVQHPRRKYRTPRIGSHALEPSTSRAQIEGLAGPGETLDS